MAGIDSNTSLMLHMDGTNGSTTFTDSGLTPKTVTTRGAVVIDTTQSVFGGASGRFDAGADSGLSLVNHADFKFGSGNWVVDTRVRFSTVATATIVDTGAAEAGGGYSYFIRYNNTAHVIRVSLSTDGTTDAVTADFSWTPSSNTWYWLAVVRSGTNLYAYIDGSQIGSTTAIGAITLFDQTNPFYIGETTTHAVLLDGWLDELRVSKGTDRGWTGSTIPVPGAAYSVSVPGVSNMSLMGV